MEGPVVRSAGACGLSGRGALARGVEGPEVGGRGGDGEPAVDSTTGAAANVEPAVPTGAVVLRAAVSPGARSGVTAATPSAVPTRVSSGVTTNVSPALPVCSPTAPPVGPPAGVTVASVRAARLDVSVAAASVAASPAGFADGTAGPSCDRAREIPPVDLAGLTCS